jgi:hypothetical protein
MAIFGFVYLWYLMVVLLLEIWFDYRPSMVVWANEKKGVMKWVYRFLTLGVSDISPRAVYWDRKLGYIITVIGIPSAFICSIWLPGQSRQIPGGPPMCP